MNLWYVISYVICIRSICTGHPNLRASRDDLSRSSERSFWIIIYKPERSFLNTFHFLCVGFIAVVPDDWTVVKITKGKTYTNLHLGFSTHYFFENRFKTFN